MSDQTPSSQDKNAETSSRTLWHRLLAKELELALAPVGVTVLTEVQISSNPPKVDILLLRRDTEVWTTEQLQFLVDGVRESQASHILIEFKYQETFQEATVQQALGYDYFYQQGQQLMRAQVETFILSGKTPRKNTLQVLGYEQTEVAGVYRSKAPLVRHVALILLNELSPTLHNAFVQCFASQRRVRQAAFQRLLERGLDVFHETLWNFVLGLQTYMQTKEGSLSETRYGAEGLTPELVMATGQQIRKALLAHLTREERLALLAHLPIEERLAGLAPEERLAGLAPEERLAGLAPEERLAGITPQELAILIKQIEIYLRTHTSTGTDR